MSKVVKVVVATVVLAPVLYITSCSAISHVHNRDFADVKEGDMAPQVIDVMGQPSDREWADGRRVPAYGAPDCTEPCVQRLWYLNRLSLVGEAWMIEMDGHGRVTRTAYIVSP
jgi:hypothetical protein